MINLSEKKWIVIFPFLIKEVKYNGEGYDYFWITEEKEVMATSRKDALRKALREWNQESYKRDQYRTMLPAKGSKRTYYIFVWKGKHTIVRARSKEQLQAYIYARLGYRIGTFFIQKLKVRRPTAEEQEEEIKSHPVPKENDPIIVCSNCKQPLGEEDFERGFCSYCDEEIIVTKKQPLYI